MNSTIDNDHDAHSRAYLNVFCALCVLTGISVGADFIDLPSKFLLGSIVLAVATAKALCVMMYFMHLKFERAWKYLLLGPTIILAISLPISLRPDIGETYYVSDVPQQRDFAEHEAGRKDKANH